MVVNENKTAYMAPTISSRKLSWVNLQSETVKSNKLDVKIIMLQVFEAVT